jgi:hypothetical protein
LTEPLRRIVVFGFIAVVAFAAAAGNASATPHAYYLFLAGAPQGCEDCYVPLLITRQPLDEVASSARDSAVVLITTYKRDSIWKVERDVPLAAVDVSVRERIVRLPGAEGAIPIHRIAPIPDRKALEDLIAAFRTRN